MSETLVHSIGGATSGRAMKVIVLVVCSLLGVGGYTITQQTQLHANLSSGYDRRVRPGVNRSFPIQININFYIVSLKEFSEGDSKIGVVGSLGMEWTDSRLVWNPADYGGDLFKTSLFVSDIWTPYMVLMNPYEKVKPVLSSGMSCAVVLNGEVSCLPPDLFEATCDADVTYYPFDSQTCTLKFFVPGYFTSDILLRPASPNFRMELYEENGLWSVLSTRNYYSMNVFGFEELRLEINMRRRTTYYIASLLLPIFFMNFIQILVFVLPVESGERVGFSITVLLAVAVFLTMIQDKLPEASEPNVSYLTYKLLVDMLLGCAMVVAVVVAIKMYHKTDNHQISDKLRAFTRRMNICCKRKQSAVYIEEKEKSPVKSPEKSPVECVNDEGDSNVTWNDVGKAFDKFFLIIFFVFLVSNNFIYLVAMAAIET